MTALNRVATRIADKLSLAYAGCRWSGLLVIGAERGSPDSLDTDTRGYNDLLTALRVLAERANARPHRTLAMYATNPLVPLLNPSDHRRRNRVMTLQRGNY
jgi:hypothetical protein